MGLEDLLAAQEAAWQAGQEFHPQLERYTLTAADQAQVRDLLQLAQRLHERLRVVVPSEEFMRRLRHELVGEPAPTAPPTILLRWRNLPAHYRVVASLGGLTLTAGLTLLAARRVLEILHRLNKLSRQDEAESDPGLSFHTVT